MLKGEKFSKDGKTYEVTAVLEGGNYAFKKAEDTVKESTVTVETEEAPKRRGSRKKKV